MTAAIWYSEKDKTKEIVKKSMGARKQGGKKDKQVEHRGFLGQ